MPMAPSSAAPTIVRARAVAAPDAARAVAAPDEPRRCSDHDDGGGGRSSLLGLRIKRSDDHDGAVVVYHVEGEEPRGQADEGGESMCKDQPQQSGLRAGCEILAIDGQRIGPGMGACRVAEVLDACARRDGAVDILASYGDRPRGSLYLVAKNIRLGQKGDVPDGSPQDASRPGSNDRNNNNHVVDGLALEETEGGRVRVSASAAAPTAGMFHGLRLNQGDALLSVDGRPVSSIEDVREALREATDQGHEWIPLLTYNVFRRLRTTVMATTMLAGSKGWDNVVVAAAEKTTTTTRPVNIGDAYDVQEKLGEGAFAVVRKATHKRTGKPYAIKIVNRSSLNKDIELALRHEVSILKELDHDHIMRLDDVVVTIKNYYLVAEYLEGGELFDRIVDKSVYTESEARDACKIVFGALSYMHSMGVAHRDLKPENLLLQYKHSDSEIKIADFGFAKKAANDHSLGTMCGTPGYVAPEVLSRKGYGTKADMWSMGVILFIMLGGYPPFYADSPRELLRQSKAGKFDFDPEYWGDISSGAKDMIRSLIVTDPAKRASADDILSHSWINEDRERLKRMSLAKTQVELRKYLARMRFKKAIHSILFVNTFTGANAVFAGRNKRNNIKALEEECAKMDIVFC